MAKMQLIVELSPELNKSQMQAAAAAVKTTLGESVKGVSFESAKAGALETALGVDKINDSTIRASSSAKAFQSAFAFNQIIQATRELTGALSGLIAVSNEYESTLAAVGSITGYSGDALDKIGEKARQLAKDFGGSASQQLESFQGVLSKLGPQVAENSDALALFGENIATLAAASGDSAANSMSAITDSMLQFGLVTGDAMKDAEASTDVINALAASAKVGAAEVPQVTQAILQAGVAAKGAQMSLEDTTAAIQVLAVGGKVGSEAGVGLRNVLGMIQKASGPAEESMKKLGTSSEELGRVLTEDGLDSALGILKTGMDGLGSAAERNAALMNIFGAENSSAAGILIENLGKYKEFADGIKSGQEGVGVAFEQAAQRMDTADGMMSRLKASMEDLFISVGQSLGSTGSALLGFANTLAPTAAAFASLGRFIPTEQLGQFAINMIQKVVPSLVIGDVATKKLVLSKSALSAANLREAAGQALSTAVKYAAVIPVAALTAAQWALNAAFLASPVGWIVAGIGAIVAGFILLYNKVDVVRNAVDSAFSFAKKHIVDFGLALAGPIGWMALLYKHVEGFRDIVDSVFNALGNAVDYVGNVFAGVGAAIGSLFSSSGESAGEAFADGFAKSDVNNKIVDSAKKIEEQLGEGIKIRATIDKEASLPAMIQKYEEMSDEISKLEIASASAGLTDEEEAKLEKLKEASIAAAAEIQKIAPAAQGASRTVVDSMGNLKLVYDVNIDKAKEFSKQAASTQLMKKAAKEYSDELTNQAKNIEKSIALNEKNLDRAKSGSEEQKQIAADRYNAELVAINANRQALLESLTAGANAGMVTSEAIENVSKALGISGEEARKLLVSKALEDAAKKGKVTEEQAGKIAEQYSYSKDKALELLAAQRRNSEEAAKTAENAKGIGEQYEENKRKLKELHAAEFAEYNALRGLGSKRDAEQEARYKALDKSLGNISAQLRDIDKLERETSEKFKTTAEQTKKAAVSKQSLYESAKKQFDEEKRAADIAKEKASLDDRQAIAESGRLETGIEKRQRSLRVLKQDTEELRRQQVELEKIASIASAERDSKKKAEYLAEVEKMKSQIEMEIQKNIVSQKEIVLSASLDDAKIKEEIARINSDSAKAKLEFDIQFGKANASEMIKYEIDELQRLIDNNQKKLTAEMDLGSAGNAAAIQQYQADIEAARREIYAKSAELDNQIAKERISRVSDADQRAYQMRLQSAKEAYAQELTMAQGNENAKLEALIKYQNEALAAEREYLSRKSVAYSLIDKIGEGFKGLDLSSAKKNFAEEAKSIDEGRKHLEESLRSRTISTAEYIEKDRQLTEQAEELKRKQREQSAVNYRAAAKVMSEALAEQASTELEKLNELAAKREAIERRSLEISREIEESKREMIKAYAEKRYEDAEAISEKISNLEDEKKESDEKSADASAAVWTKSLDMMGMQFAAFAVESGKIGQSLAKSLFSTAKAMVPSFVVMILGKSIESLGPILGPIASGVLTATLYGLLSAAESAIGFRSGGYTGDGNPDAVAGVVHKGEYVMKASSTARNFRALSEIDKGGVTVEKWYETTYADKIQSQVADEAANIAMQAMIAYRASGDAEISRTTNELSKKVEENTKSISEMTAEIKKGNYARKTKVEYDFKMRLDKDKMLKEVEMSSYKNIKRM